MGLNYENLDANTRTFMVAECEFGFFYQSPRLTLQGLENWPRLMREASTAHNDDWLAAQIIEFGFMNGEESYSRNGKMFTRRINIPHSAQQLGEGEFNRFYIRALCSRAIHNGTATLEVYRARASERPRPESEAKIGMRINADDLREALRKNDFVTIEDALAVPGGPIQDSA